MLNQTLNPHYQAAGHFFHSIIALVALFLLVTPGLNANAQESVIPDGLVGRWEFDDGTGKDLSGYGNDALLEKRNLYSLGDGQYCIELLPDTGPVRIPVKENSPLAIKRGTILRCPMTMRDNRLLVGGMAS